MDRDAGMNKVQEFRGLCVYGESKVSKMDSCKTRVEGVVLGKFIIL